METSPRWGGTWRPGALPGVSESWLYRTDGAAQGGSLPLHKSLVQRRQSQSHPLTHPTSSVFFAFPDPPTFFSLGFAEMAWDVLPPVVALLPSA